MAAIVASAVGLAACGPKYDHTDITAVKSSGLGGGLDKAALSVPEGLVVKAHIVVMNDDNKPMDVSIRALDPSFVEVAGVVNDRDYAFLGKRVGHTQIEFATDDTVVLTLEADVTAQPEPSSP
jgi:hypothetical protein